MSRVEKVDTQTARAWFRKYHYLGSAGNAQVGAFGYYASVNVAGGEDLIAVVNVGQATNAHGLAKRFELTDWKGNIEVSRVAVHPDAPKNTASRAIAATLDVLRDQGYEWVFSYADTGQGHHGGIYQALNAVYCGLSEGRSGFTVDGEPIHPRTVVARFGTQAWAHKDGSPCPGRTCESRRCVGRIAATRDGVVLQKVDAMLSAKHTYILVIAANKRDRRELRDHLKQFELPYPKRDDGTLAVASGENDPASSGESQGQSLGTAPKAEDTGDRRSVARSHLRLYPYQRVGAAFMATARSAINGDEMRLGKTPQTIRAMQLLDAVGESVFPALIVAPASVKRVWRDAFDEWWPGARLIVPRAGTAAAVAAINEVRAGNADVLVVNYETLPNVSRLAPYGSVRLEGCIDCDPLSKRAPNRCQRERKVANEVTWRTVVADEVHRASEPRAQMTRALWSLGDPAEFRYALTGSPPDEVERLWAIARFMSPSEYARKTSFIDRYAETAPNIWSGFAEPTGFNAATRAEFDRFFLPRFIRRTVDAVMPDLPPKTYMVRDVELTGKQRKAYDDMRATLVARLEDGTIFAANPLMELLRLRQFACAYGETDGVGGMTLAEPSSKLDVLEEVLAELGDRQAVVFAESRQLIDLAAARFEGLHAARITGDVPENMRASALSDFQDGVSRVLFCTIGAGGEGLDMSAADTAIFLQRSFSARMNMQAEARIRGPKQTSASTTIVDLVATGTVEDHVRDVLADKAARVEDLVRDKETLRRWLS